MKPDPHANIMEAIESLQYIASRLDEDGNEKLAKDIFDISGIISDANIALRRNAMAFDETQGVKDGA